MFWPQSVSSGKFFFTSIYTDQNGFPHDHGLGVFLSQKKIKETAIEMPIVSLCYLHQINRLGEYGVIQTLTHPGPILEAMNKNMCRVNFRGHAF